jgi:hypothetical protein
MLTVEQRMLERWRGLLSSDVHYGLAPLPLPFSTSESRGPAGARRQQQHVAAARRCVDLFLLPTTATTTNANTSVEDELYEWVFASRGPHACLAILDDHDDHDAVADDDGEEEAAEKLALFNWLAPALLWTRKSRRVDRIISSSGGSLDTATNAVKHAFKQVARRVQQVWRALNASRDDHSDGKEESSSASQRASELQQAAAVLIESLAVLTCA